MKPLHTLHRLLGVGALTLAALSFMGSACEKNQTRPQTETQPTDTATQTAAQQTSDDAGGKTTVPDDIGPKAPALFVVSGLKGYTEPCGCTLDIMLGGIDRIVRYHRDASALYPGHVLVDAGDLLFEHTEYEEAQLPQERARVDVITAALQQLKPVFTVPGERDFALGAEFYTQALKAAEITPHAVNLTVGGQGLGGAVAQQVGNLRVQLIPVVEPELFANIEGVVATAPETGIRAALDDAGPYDARVLVAHGGLAFVKAQLTAFPALNFGVVGHNPRETDQADQVGDAFTLEPYDQGRYFGILKLYPAQGDTTFANARQGSKAELENIEKQIKHVDDSIGRLPPETSGNESPMRLNLRARLAELNKRKAELSNAAIDVPTGQSAFLWRTVPMEPTLAVDPEMEKVRVAYNKSLKGLNTAVEREIPPAKPGEAIYIGGDQCAMCHAPAHAFWEKTPHARAWETLEKRDKEFDQSCVGCHVVGYEKPGGAVVGKVEYEETLRMAPDAPALTFTKNLRDVGCESCHGPGSLHRFNPVDAAGKAQHILPGSGAQTCMQCHVPEHSPRFNYETYIKIVTGEGHQLSTP